MKSFASIVAAFAAIASVASALPAASDAAAVSRSFKLKTKLISGMAGFDGQYLEAYHTGAGFNAPTFSKSGGITGYINGTTAQFVYGDGENAFLALGGTEDFYSGWGSMTFNLGGIDQNAASTEGFSVGPNGYFTHAKNDNYDFNGWRVCNWVHDAPELFYDTTASQSSDVPANCARVYLVAEYV